MEPLSRDAADVVMLCATVVYPQSRKPHELLLVKQFRPPVRVKEGEELFFFKSRRNDRKTVAHIFNITRNHHIFIDRVCVSRVPPLISSTFTCCCKMNAEVVEFVAGLCGEAESQEACARRELFEEVGYQEGVR